MSDTATNLLNAAEDRMRAGGYHDVSFRDLAADLGIKSASVHYYFPKKEDLGVQVIERYRDRLLGSITDKVAGGQAKLPAYVETYREALVTADKACLCGIMGAEAQGLPEPVRAAVHAFMQANVDWLTVAFEEAGADTPHAKAVCTLATLQGAMMLAVNLGGVATFDEIANQVLNG